MWNLKYDTNEFTKKKQAHNFRKQIYGYQQGKWGREGKNWEFGISRGKLVQIGWINNKVQQKRKILRGGKNTQKNCTKKIFTTQIITMV